MTALGIFPIVEGHGDVDAVRALLRRFAQEIHQRYDYRIEEPFRLPRTKFAKDADLLGALRLASIKLRGFARRHVLVLMDGDDDCPAAQHARVMRLAGDAALEIDVRFVMPVREYEAWFIGCLDRTKAHPELRAALPYAPDPAAIRDAKGWFRDNMLAPGRPYSPSVDQAKFTYLIDLTSNDDRALAKLRKEMAAIFAA